MSALYMNKVGGNKRLLESCPSAPLLWAATRIGHDLHWRWDDDGKCYQTHRWSRDAHYSDVRSWPADHALSSFLRAIREDDRLGGDPLIKTLAFYMTLEYLTAALERHR